METLTYARLNDVGQMVSIQIPRELCIDPTTERPFVRIIHDDGYIYWIQKD